MTVEERAKDEETGGTNSRLLSPVLAPVRWAINGRLVVPALLLVLVIRRWYQLGSYPPGVDEGHWLAIGRSYLGQDSDVSRLFSPFVMPPGVPVLLNVLARAIGPFEASRAIAAASIGSVMGAVFFVGARYSGAWLAGASAALIGFSILVIDPSAWGGYPQNFALGGLVLSVYFLGEFLSCRHRATGLLLSTLGVSLAHHALYGVLIAASVGVGLLWLLEERPTRPRLRRLGIASACFVPSGIVFGIVVVSLERSGYTPAVNAGQSTLTGTLQYIAPDPRLWWSVVATVGVLSLVGTLPRRTSSQWKAALSLTVTGGTAFLVTVEPRFLSAVAAGLALAVALGTGDLARRKSSSAVWNKALAYASIAFLVFVLAPSSDSRAGAAYAWFATVDGSYADAARWIESQPGDGAVAMRTDNRAWPVGWWMRGLTSRTVFVGSDERWLGFPSEVEDAAFVADLFADGRSQQEIVRRAETRGIAFLVFRSDQWLGWESWELPGQGMTAVYANDRYMVIGINK